jgi:large subunit ribosomal protein L21
MLEKIALNAGDSFVIDKVLLVGSPDFTAVGRPYVKNAMVVCTVEENCRTEKVIVFKKKRRKGYQRNKGHRQDVTMVRVDTIFYTPDNKVVENNRLL